MHYDAYAFGSEKGKITMEPTNINFLTVIGKAKDASARDWQKVRLVYECAPSSQQTDTSDDTEIATPRKPLLKSSQ